MNIYKKYQKIYIKKKFNMNFQFTKIYKRKQKYLYINIYV